MHKHNHPTFIISLAILYFLLTATLQASNNRLSPLGINTNEVIDMDSSVPFIDLFRLAMPFEEARPWLTKGKIQYDKHGWPIKLSGGQAGTRFINNFPADSIPNTAYNVYYHGKGKMIYGGNAKLIRRLPGRDIIQIRANKEKRITATLTIVETDDKYPIRDIRVILPGGICKGNPYARVASAKSCKKHTYQAFSEHSKTQIFNPDYLSFMKSFRVIRYMNMSGITRNNLKDWDKRPKMTDATWGGKEGSRGVPIEVMVELSNLLGADPWFNFPHRADDDFVRQFAQYTKKHLKPNLKAYIEYTNEAWNGIFSQAHYLMDVGEHQRLDANRAYAGYKYYSKRSVEIFKIWESVFGDNRRFVRVMGGMATNTALTHMLLGYQDAYKHTDALAIAPYFHATQNVQKNIKSVDQVFEILQSNKNPYSIPRTLKNVKAQSRIAKRYGVDVIAYEGGQHLVAYKTHSNDEGSNPHLINANKDDRMAKLYYEFLEGWKKAGGKLFVAFSAPRDYNWIGSWGIKEHIAQHPHEAPKYRGLMFFQRNQRCWWQHCTTATISRNSKPSYNPGTKILEKRFKPVAAPSKLDNKNVMIVSNDDSLDEF